MRQFWVPYFSDDVKAIIFITALSSYDQFCEEDETLNRMVDSLQVFEKIISNKLLSKASMLVFLNKVDLFELKIPHSPINVYFPDYTGKGIEQGREFFKKKFLKAAGSRQVYAHFTQNTDTKVTAFVIASIQTIIVDSILKNVNFI